MERDIESFKKNESTSRTLEGQELEDSLDSQLMPVCLLLVGYAIENLIKGIIYSRKPELLIEEDKNLKLSEKLKKHELAELYACKYVGLVKNSETIDRDTKEILDVLQQFIIWQGRYPVPLNLQQLRNKKTIPLSLRDPKKINELSERLLSILDKIPQPSTHLSRRLAEK